MKLLSNYFQVTFTLLSISDSLFFIRYLCGVSEKDEFESKNITETEPIIEKIKSAKAPQE